MFFLFFFHGDAYHAIAPNTSWGSIPPPCTGEVKQLKPEENAIKVFGAQIGVWGDIIHNIFEHRPLNSTKRTNIFG